MTKKPDLAVVIGMGKPHEGEPMSDDSDHDQEQAKKDAADALIEAVKASDSAGVVQALEAFCDLHYSSDEGEEEDQGEDEEPEQDGGRP
jgi:hypothetical protein